MGWVFRIWDGIGGDFGLWLFIVWVLCFYRLVTFACGCVAYCLSGLFGCRLHTVTVCTWQPHPTTGLHPPNNRTRTLQITRHITASTIFSPTHRSKPMSMSVVCCWCWLDLFVSTFTITVWLLFFTSKTWIPGAKVRVWLSQLRWNAEPLIATKTIF